MLIVFGAIAMELRVPVDQFPTQTLQATASDYVMNAGGKATAQAFAATRSGAKVAIIGKTGIDDYAKRIVDKLRREGVVTTGVGKSESTHTGLKIIATDKTGQVQIINSPGANTQASAEQCPEEILKEQSILLLQTDLNGKENLELLKKAKANGAKTILNLAPTITITQDVLDNLDYLILNNREAKNFAAKMGIPSDANAKKIAEALSKIGNLTCIITLGEDGAIAYSPEDKIWHTPGIELKNLVDRHAAEDVFCGTFAACVQASMHISSALRRANIAAGISCEKAGGLASFPYLSEIDERLAELGDIEADN